MRLAGGTAAFIAAFALLSAGCGDGDSPRDRVDAYVRSANAVQQRYAADFKTANEAYTAYARGDLEGADAVAPLAQAVRRMRAARADLDRLTPPANAARLHELVLRVLDMNLRFARETEQLARFVPAAEDALAPLARENRRLDRALRRADGAAGQSRALRRFARGLASVLGDLRALDPPPILSPTHEGQTRRLRSARRLATRLDRALVARDAKRVATLLVRFRRSVSGREVSPARAERAIAQYNRRYRGLTEAYADVQREETRLDRSLD